MSNHPEGERVVELVEHQGHKIRLRRTAADWIAFVARRRERPVVILASDREALLAKAFTWIDQEAGQPGKGSD
ncbi:hypothetical protein [Microvirga brassicacearum]|uniref:Uncharacterized protein n=1 Tax=Microvirga brassicacearum TaxID=2580413 RepID=A0A5N3PDP3_9HYPH|nr:hypothetical protein [Microvirga brassicacearum]KAB0267862.1 hypothetical protein FEZ63_07570 [Microvirga brassicacearum]